MAFDRLMLHRLVGRWCFAQGTIQEESRAVFDMLAAGPRDDSARRKV